VEVEGEEMTMDLEATLCGLPGAAVFDHQTDGLWMTALAIDVTAMACAMQEEGARLSTMTAVALESGETTIIYHYCVGRTAINIKTQTSNHVQLSLAPLTPSAAWIEREIHDLFGVEFVGHPGLTRLVRPPTLPEGFFRVGARGADPAEQ
jgi:Ni,Fe-hydrogenase III component G